MSTPHRGLPPPSAMNLPDPSRHPPPSLGQPLAAMPHPPNQWQGQEDSMRNWLVAKAEEDKRKQEEEKTRQEGLRLEQRRIEQSMLRDSLQAGVPPAMIPMIYAGIGGANLANVSVDWLQQYAAQLQASQQHVQQPPQQQQQQQLPSPEVRRESRTIIHGHGGYPIQQAQQQQPLHAQPAEPVQSAAPLQTTFSTYQSAVPRTAPTAAPRSATHTQLPRLTTNEMYIHQPPTGNPSSAHPLQQTQTISDQPSSSPSIYFHHWVPPNESKGQPQTPATKGGEPLSAHPGSHLSEESYKESPRKRKAQGGHQANPPPSAGPQYTSPSFSNASNTSRKPSHARSRSNASAKEPSNTRPDSRRDLEPPNISRLEVGEDRGSRDSMRHYDDRLVSANADTRQESRRGDRGG
ncbi:hypothetical protein LTR62_001124 [Meristemomyces frigidus]|uniref:Uncharacterized protein n=1 Tax=Meristemomyces frigidus TaxID=1508187 RepID=A0AAN7TG95_9PEZI|nr:hypothetical protein LTR62_001124 [Meristemomyces frigidus]